MAQRLLIEGRDFMNKGVQWREKLLESDNPKMVGTPATSRDCRRKKDKLKKSFYNNPFKSV